MFEIIVILVCLTLNAILSCVEMAFVTVSKPHLKKLAADGDKQAQNLINLKSNPERVLSVLQIGITLVGAISAAVGGAGAEENLSPWFQSNFQVSEEFSETLSIVAVVLPITFLSVVIGELVPKTLALKFPMRFAKFGSHFLNLLDRLFAPVVFLLEASTKVLLQVFLNRLKPETLSEATSTLEIDSLSDVHKQYVLNLIDVDRRKAKDVMLPWKEVTTISRKARHAEVLDVIKSSGHTRIPVTDQNLPVGILHSKQFIAESEISKLDWLQLTKKVILIDCEEPILNALKTLQNSKSHLGIVTKSSQPEPLGIITIEDIFEEIVGDIYDEYDSPQILLSSNSRIRTMNVSKD